MNKLSNYLVKKCANLCILIALGISGSGISLLFFGEPKYPVNELKKKYSEFSG